MVGLEYIFDYILEIVKLYLIVFIGFQCEKREKKEYILIFGFGILLSFLWSIFVQYDYLSTYVLAIIMLGTMICSLKRFKQFPMVLFAFTGIGILDALFVVLFRYITQIPFDIIGKNPILSFGLNALSLPLLIWMTWVIQNNRKSIQVRILYSRKILLIVFLFIICIQGVLLAFRPLYQQVKEDSFLLFVFLFGVLFVSCIGLLYIYESSRRTQLQFQNDWIKQMMKQQKNYYEKLLKREMEIKKFKHDVKNHFYILQQMILLKDKDIALKYIQEIDMKYKIFSSSICSGNEIVDMMIQDTLEKSPDVHIQLHGRFIRKLKMEDLDICILFGNLLKNAAEAVHKVEDKSINLQIECFSTNVILKESNDYDKAPIMKQGRPITTKDDKLSHGIGIKNMEEVVMKYNGSITYAVDKRFMVKIILENVIRE